MTNPQEEIPLFSPEDLPGLTEAQIQANIRAAILDAVNVLGSEFTEEDSRMYDVVLGMVAHKHGINMDSISETPESPENESERGKAEQLKKVYTPSRIGRALREYFSEKGK